MEVGVEAVPIVVESTTEEYFVLYVRHDLDGTVLELPVSVTLGENGTSTLAENVEALPKERYLVEKFLIADPADVDGDCIDDITELGDPAGMNPVNPAAAINLTDGAVAVPDRAAFEALSNDFPADRLSYVKFVLFGMDTDRPGVYFANTETYLGHPLFYDAVGLEWDQDGTVAGQIGYRPELAAPDGSLGVYFYWLRPSNAHHPLSLEELSYTMLAASMPLLETNLALYMSNDELRYLQSSLPLYSESRIPLVFDGDIFPEARFLALNPGEGYGLLRVMDPDERPHARDIVIYEALPNELPRVAGIISTVPQTPLSHVNLRAIQDRVPNAYIRDALNKSDIGSLLGNHVRYEVTDTGYSIRAATRAEVDAHYASFRPAHEQTPQRDLSITAITPLSEIGFGNWTAFGVKAANVAVLGTLGFPEGTVPDGFAIPFYFYDEFMKHNGFYASITTMLADPDFQANYTVQESELKKLRKAIKKGETPGWITTALEGTHGEFPNGTSLRYRSSTNNEDLPGFSGAGLYDSKTQHPEETEEDGISKSLKQVYASLWNFRAFAERDFHRINHTAAAMGVLVHPNYSDELVNGVAVSFDPLYGRDKRHYVNTQLGEDLVTNPDAHSVPEEILLHRSGGYYSVLATSNQVPPGQLLMSNGQLAQLGRHLTVIHEEFRELYNPGLDEQFAMEIEFKITSANILAIKQARPWVFSTAAADTTAPTVTSIERSDPAEATTSERTLVFAVTFSEDVTGVSQTDFGLSPDSIGGGSGSGQFTQTSEPAIPITDHNTIQDTIAVSPSGTATSVSVAVDISHAYIGDLVVDLIAPDGTAQTLHSRAGDSADSINRTYTPDFGGTGIAGDWILRIRDHSTQDTGTLSSWTLTVNHGGADSPVTGLTGSGDAYLVTVSAAQNGTYNLDLASSGHGIADAADNPLADPNPTGADHTYTVSAIPADATAPTVTSIVRSSPAGATTSERTLVFAVTFSEDVTGVDAGDFALSPGSTGGGSSSGQFTQTSEPALRIADRSTIQDAITVDRSGTATSVSVAVDISHTYIGDLVVDLIAPDDTSQTLHSRTGGSANDIDRTYAPGFDGTGIAGDWILRVSDRAGGDVGTLNGWTLTIGHDGAGSPVTGLAGSGDAYLVTVSAAQDGTYNLDLVSSGHGITDTPGNPLSSPTPTGADHTYTVSATVTDSTAPTLASIERSDPSGELTPASTLVFEVTFSEAAQNVDAGDFELSGTGAGSITVSAVSGDTYNATVAVNTDGTFNLNIAGGHNIEDLAGMGLSSVTPTGADQSYTVDRTAPTVTSIVRSSPAGATTSGRTLVLAVTFSEDVTGVDAGDFALSPGSTGGGSGSGQFTQTSEPATPIADRSTIQDAITVNRSGTATSVSVAVDISHTYIGDLVVELVAPDGTAQTLHSRSGSSANDIDRTYAPGFDGTGIAGNWTLRVSDRAGGDVGTLNGWTLTIGHGTAGSPVTGLAGSGSRYLVTVSAAQDGTYNLDLVSSGHGITDTPGNPLNDTSPTGEDQSYTVTILNVVPNSMPSVDAGSDQTVQENSVVTLSGTASDADDDPLTYLWSHDSDLTIALSDAASLSTSFTAPQVDSDTTITFTLAAYDETSNATDTTSVTITDSTPPVVADAPRSIGSVTLASTVPGVVEASWDAPAEEPGDYRIAWAKVGEGFRTWTDLTVNAFPTTTSHAITDLEEGAEYKVIVRARYDGGSGDWSDQYTVTVKASVQDTTDPTITLTGANPVSVTTGTAYSDPGATCTDDTDASPTLATTSTVDTLTAGTYQVTYTCTDSSGNTATATRDVVAADAPDTTDPTITLTGANPVSVTTGTAYSDPGATCTDDTDASPALATTSSVDTLTAGTYQVTYTCTDSSGNTATATRDVVVADAPDTTDPTITLTGANPVSVTTGTAYSDPGATCTDDTDASPALATTSSVDTLTAGTYQVTYTCTDSSSNTATATRDVVVADAPDTTAPTVTKDVVVVDAPDTTAPTVSSIERHIPTDQNTGSQTLVYRVTFSENVTGVDVGDFVLSPDSPVAGGASGQFAQTSEPAIPIPDRNTIQDAITVDQSGTATSVSVAVDISHTYIGDLVVDLIAPDGTTRTLHDSTGYETDDIDQTYAPDFGGVGIAGDWTLRIRDGAGGDTGTLNGWTLTVNHGGADSPVTGLAGSGSQYLVTVSAPREGTYNLDVIRDSGIADAADNPLSSPTPTGADHTYTRTGP